MDACLGLYDMYYDTYDIEEKVLQAADSETEAENTDAAEDDAQETADNIEETADSTEAAESDMEETAAAVETRTHKVVSGDSLWNIAQDQYGDGSKWNVIYEANKEEISDPGLIFPGQELKIPNAA